MAELLVSDSETAAPLFKTEERSVEPSLLIPWSCRESFTAHVCGLPGSSLGCSRHRDTIDGRLREKAIAPLGEPEPGSVAAWIVFECMAGPEDENVYIRISDQGVPNPRPGFHQALFGFDEAGVEAINEGRGYYPVYLKFLAFKKEIGAHQEVTSWLRSEDVFRIGLSACFGSNIFTPGKPNKEPGCRIRCEHQVSIAGLINAFLDNRCSFRGEPYAENNDLQRRNLGITICKVEVALSEKGFNRQGERYLNSCDIAFSLLDPDTLTIKRVAGRHLGMEDADIHPSILNLDERYFRSLYVAPNPERRGETNYAYCLSNYGRLNYGRMQILPTEVGKSFLTFSAGEMCSYLLHWFLLRIFAYGRHPNDIFARKFQDWLDAGGDEQRRRRLFRELLRTPVLLPVDTNVFKEDVKELAGRGRYLGIYDEPTPFGEALGTLGLDSPDGAWIRQTAEFLLRYHTLEDNPDQDLRSLPMFEDLKWSDAGLLRQVHKATPETEDELEAIVHYLASSFNGKVPDPETAQEGTDALTRSCVFPIAEALPHLSSSLRLPLYYIFPLWEDTVGWWHGPVIFAHVFTRALPFDPDVQSDQDRHILDMGTELQNLLAPIVSAIAHANYNAEARKHERIRHEAEEQKRLAVAAYKLGHPLKDRVGPLRAILNSLKRELSRMPSAAHLEAEVNNAGDLLTRISQLGHILDMTSVAMMDNKGAAAFLKEGKEYVWRVEGTYDLHTQIPKLNKLGKDPRAAREILLQQEDLMLLSGARIEPWIADEEGVLWRPGDLFYDEVISEVLTNAAKYGKRVEGCVTLRLEIGDVNGKRCLLVSNECQTTPNADKIGLRLNEWRLWNTSEDGAIGGLFYIANSLSQTKSGSVYATVKDEGAGCLFVVGLQLTGLVADGTSNK